MHDRQRLLVYSTLILVLVAAAGVGITGLQFVSLVGQLISALGIVEILDVEISQIVEGGREPRRGQNAALLA